MKKRILLYLAVITIPLALGLVTWQSVRYQSLEWEVEKLSVYQEDLILQNKNLISDIAKLSSSARINKIAKADSALEQKPPEDILQVVIK